MAYPTQILRTLALHKQGLTSPLVDRSDHIDRDEVLQMVKQVGCIQIDTLQMVARSQYVAMWSRLGNYDPSVFDSLIYLEEINPNERQLFEYWYHAACLIPLEHYRYHLPTMDKMNKKNNHYQKWLMEGSNREMVEHVQERIKKEGGLRGADFKQDKKRKGSWWNWKPSKRALEYLYNIGELMIANRLKFQRVYDLRERVLPDWVDTRRPSQDEFYQFFIEEGVKMMGVCFPNQSSDYTHEIKRTPARDYIEKFIKDGVFVEIQAVLHDDSVEAMIIHRDDLPLLGQIADGEIKAERTTFLSPFDNLFWTKDRDQQLWGFDQTLEAYKKPHDRVWGYFCLPILHKDQLVGRFDVKLDRKASILYVRALHLQPNIDLNDEMLDGIANAFGEFLKFHDANEVVIEKSNPQSFGAELRKRLN